MRQILGRFVVASPSKSDESVGRLAASLACRRWYDWRVREREFGINPPVWVLTAPPWPVLRLAYKLAGKPIYLAVFQHIFGLLGSHSDELGETGGSEQVSDLPNDGDPSLRGRLLAMASWLGVNRWFSASVY